MTTSHSEAQSNEVVPLHTHDCEQCKFLGPFEDKVDLYFCEQGSRASGIGPTVIARYGSLGHQYTSGLGFSHLSPWLGEAKRRAIELGHLPALLESPNGK